MSNDNHGRHSFQLLGTALDLQKTGVQKCISIFLQFLKLPKKEATPSFQLFWGSRTLGEDSKYTIPFPEGKQKYLHTPT